MQTGLEQNFAALCTSTSSTAHYVSQRQLVTILRTRSLVCLLLLRLYYTSHKETPKGGYQHSYFHLPCVSKHSTTKSILYNFACLFVFLYSILSNNAIANSGIRHIQDISSVKHLIFGKLYSGAHTFLQTEQYIIKLNKLDILPEKLHKNSLRKAIEVFLFIDLHKRYIV